MWYYFLKLIISSVLIVLISEVAKRSSVWGALLASLPLVSILSIIWLYIDTKDVPKIAALSWDIFWLVLPSLLFFVVLPLLLKKVAFPWAMLGAAGITVISYLISIYILKK